MDGWVRTLLQRLTPPGAEARTLDEITTTEILDLAYIQGAAFDSAVSAHALFPQYVEESERTAGPSSMSVTFPVQIEEETVYIRVATRWGLASALQIGQGGRGKVVNLRGGHPIPDALKHARIGNTNHELGEPGGDRLRTVAGPMRVVEHELRVELNRLEGEQIQDLTSPAQNLVYGWIDGHGTLQAQYDPDGGLVGSQVRPATRRTYATYLWGETRPTSAVLKVSWVRQRPDRALVTVTLRNATESQAGDRASAGLLGAFLMPHVEITVEGGAPAFPPLQYAEAKRHFLLLRDEEERQREANRRLYEVRQSGCIATCSPVESTTVVLTTFGIFDTPRERPEPGPAIAELAASREALLGAMDHPSDAVRELITLHWPVLRSVLLSIPEAFDGVTALYRFQWDAIHANLELVATGSNRPVTVVRAPTGAGKTVVFLVNAAVSALCAQESGSAVLMFPTRLLNEDMFRRLTAFVRAMRGHASTAHVRGGLLMGTSDPLYRVLLSPDEGEIMHHFGACPECGEGPLVARQEQGRMVPECAHCAHRVNYMYTSYDVPAFLPDIVIATPDKLFYEATAAEYEQYRIGLFGAPIRRCTTCGRACPEAYLALKPAALRCAEFHRQAGCPGRERSPTEVRPIRYMGFDEVHSLYGVTATYLSMFLADLEALQVLLSQRRVGIRYETATATISNERDLIEALTRRSAAQGEIRLIPPQGQEADYFHIVDESVRHRVLATLPTRSSSKQAFIRSSLNTYLHLHGDGDGHPADLEGRLAAHTPHPGDWRFLLGYLFKKQEGADMRRALRDMYRNEVGPDLSIEFLSGEAPKDQISRILERSVEGEIDILLANLVISLGIDIHGLNHMIMLGVPQGFTEFVQTAGRTGRGRSSGHVHIILAPFNPRDGYLYRHFHAVLSDVAGYYDVLPVKSTNLYCAREMFGNVAKSILMGLCMQPNRPHWTHARGITEALGTLRGGDAGARAGIARILCDDPELRADTEEMVRARFGALMQQLGNRNGFLSALMRAPSSEWLIRSLRGRSGARVRVICTDDALLARLRAPLGTRGDGVEPDDAADA